MTTKKAQQIFNDTYQTLDTYIRKGQRFDSLTCVVSTDGHKVTKATVADLEKLCMMEFHKVERHAKWFGEEYPRRIEREVETARRMWLTIQNTKREVAEWGVAYTK